MCMVTIMAMAMFMSMAMIMAMCMVQHLPRRLLIEPRVLPRRCVCPLGG